MDPRDVTSSLVGERVGGRFVIEKLIGAGPLSSAFRARDDLLQRRVTVKLFHPDHADDIAVVESQLLLATSVARLSHPNIATIIDRGEHDGHPFIVTEYVRGENLEERIDRFAPLSAAEVIALGTSIAKALAYAHGQGVCHGNLRPGNILISEDRDVKLADFGGGSFIASLTGDPYVAPERSLGVIEGDPTPAEDVFCLGVLMFVALTEELPTQDIDVSRIQMFRPDASPRLAQVIVGAIAPDPSFRYATMRDVLSDMATIPSAVVDTPSPDATSLIEASAIVAAPRTAKANQPAKGRAKPKPPRSRARLLVWSMVLVPLVALVLVGSLIAGERNQAQRNSPAKPRALAGPTVALDIASVHSFDPQGSGGENDLDLSLMYDADPETYWQTEGYDAQLGGSFKSGLGVYIDMGQPVALRHIEILSDRFGWEFDVLASNKRVNDLKQWMQLSPPGTSATDIKTSLSVDTGTTRYRYYMFWITKLALSPDDGGKYRARITELSVTGIK